MRWRSCNESSSGGASGKELSVQETREMRVRALGHEDPLEKGMAAHSQYSCLKSPMDRGAWKAAVPGVAKSWTRPKGLSRNSTKQDKQLHLRSSAIRLQRLGTPAINALMRVDVDSKARLGVLGLPSQLCRLE